MAYLPSTDADRAAMLKTIGAASVADLFRSIPTSLLNPPLELPEPLGEQDLVAELSRLASRNRPLTTYDNFLGAGVYLRFSPAIVRATISRPEFYTAYTPYQAEGSQGTLQTIFEFQSMICALTGLDVANASLYDGATAAAEAAILASFLTGRHRVAVSDAVHPEVLEVLRTFAHGRGMAVDVVAAVNGITPAAAMSVVLTDDHCAMVVAQPNFLGNLEDAAALAAAAKKVGALAVAYVDPIACAALVSPGEAGFDVAVGDGQPLGIPASFGGPHVGFMAVRQELMRRIPGRLVGMTVDHAGRRAYTLTLQTREQHIRREKATSNICTNHALIALAATVYMARMGAGGMRAVAEVSAQRTHALAQRLTAIDGFSMAFPDAPFLWEFVLRTPGDAGQVAATLREKGIIGGLPLTGELSDCLLVCCTETTLPQSIENYVAAAKAISAARVPA